MAITMVDAFKNSLLTSVGSILSGGTLEIQTAGSIEIATLILSSAESNALNTPSGGSATFKAITADSSATGGTAAKFVMKTSGGVAQYSGTVATSGGDMTIDNTTVAVGATVSAGTVTASF